MEWAFSERDPLVERHAQHAYLPMLHTAETVARRYAISREAQDAWNDGIKICRGVSEGRQSGVPEWNISVKLTCFSDLLKVKIIDLKE
jgi:hypothetical protein